MDVQPQVNVVKDDNMLRAQGLFLDFLRDFRNEEGHACYWDEVAMMPNPERNTLRVHFSHLLKHSSDLSFTVETQFYKVFPYLCEAVRLGALECCEDDAVKSRLHRKEFYVSFVDYHVKHKVRELTADKVGTLLRIRGQVVRTHPVHPELCRGTFVCDECGVTTKNVTQQFKYTQPTRCQNPQCQNRSQFMLDIHDSQFVDFQRLRIQETQEELPLGCIPRNVEVIMRGEAVETAQPGDHCDFTGTLIVIPDVASLAAPGLRAQTNSRTRGRGNAAEVEGVRGLKALGVRDLNYKLAFLACSISPSNPAFGGVEFNHEEISHSDLWAQMSLADQRRLKSMSDDKDITKNLSEALFPNIFGNDRIKLGILLMMFGGVPKRTSGSTLRGDLNVCLVGDPSCGKSQFLKTVEKFSPRVVYTSGKASSAAGLTAAVVKDEESFDFVIEAGALMLADNGICCIDEFDKMDPKDQVAIHEAMEQQTISITKAGVKATLNARCSILAAANPVGGRYDESRPLHQNVALSAPIMSRFDLFFILRDTPSEVTDFAIARRILDNHESSYSHKTPNTVYDVDDVRKYIMFARCFKPKLSEEAAQELKSAYKKLRLGEGTEAGGSTSWRITVRQLESLIRLSEALARLHCVAQVTIDHVREAHDLLLKSIVHVISPDIGLGDDDDMDEPMDVEAPGEALRDISNASNAGEAPADEDAGSETQMKIDPAKLTVTRDQFNRITCMLVLHLRKEEENVAEGEEFDGVRHSDLVDWYITKIEEDLETAEDWHMQKTIVEKIIKRLVGTTLISLSEPEEQDPLIMVNPNYVLNE